MLLYWFSAFSSRVHSFSYSSKQFIYKKFNIVKLVNWTFISIYFEKFNEKNAFCIFKIKISAQFIQQYEYLHFITTILFSKSISHILDLK